MLNYEVKADIYLLKSDKIDQNFTEFIWSKLF